MNPKTVLDIGTGCFGKNAYILRQYVEHKFRKLYNPEYLVIHGIEAYKPNYDYVSSLKLYDELFLAEALKALRSIMDSPRVFSPYDVIICTHVLEHHTKEDGWKLLDWMYSFCNKGIILACPWGEYEHKDDNNHYQNHLSHWTPIEIAEHYPTTTPVIGRNNVGKEEFIIVIPK
jgi:predicted SAM-dependent methyltransferase